MFVSNTPVAEQAEAAKNSISNNLINFSVMKNV